MVAEAGALGAASGAIELDAAKALAALSQVGSGLKDLDRQSQSLGKSDAFGGFVTKNKQAINDVGLALTGFGAITGAAFGFGVHAAMNFQAQMSAVQSVTGATGDDMSALRAEALRLGKDTSFSATESAAAMEILAKAGVSTADIINGSTEDILNLANATGEGVENAAETAGAAMNVFKVSSTDAANIIARSANVSALSLNDWTLAMKSAAPVAGGLGVSMDDLANAMIVLGDAGIKGQVGATALRNIMMNLANTASDGSEALAAYGVATVDASGKFRGLQAITHDLVGTWDGLTQAQQLNLAQQVAGRDGAAAFVTIMKAQSDAAKEGTDAFADADKRMQGVGDAATQAAQRMDNLKGTLEQLRGTLETIGIAMTTGLLPAFKSVLDLANRVAGVFLKLPAPVQTATGAILGIVAALALGSGGFLLALPRIVSTIKAVQDLRKALAGGRLASFFAGLGPMLPIILAVAAALALLFIAYKTNFLGFGDGVRWVAAQVKAGFDAIKDAISAVAGYLHTAFSADNTLKGLGKFPKLLQPIIQGFGIFADTLGDFKRAWQKGGALGVLRAIPDELGDIGAGFKKIFGGIGGVADALGRKFTAFRSSFRAMGDFFRELGSAAQSFTLALRKLAQGDISGALRQLGDGARSLLRAIADGVSVMPRVILDAVRAIPWGTVGAALVDGFAAAWRAIEGLAADAWDWLTDSLGAIDWGEIGQTIVTALGDALRTMGKALAGLWDWLTDSLGAVDWGGIGQTILAGLRRAVAALAGAAMDLGAWTLNTGIPALAGWIKDVAGDVWSGLRALAGWAWDAAPKLGAWTLNTAIPSIAGWIKSAASGVWGAIKSVAAWTWDAVADLGAWTLDTGLPTLLGWVKDVAGDIWGGIRSLAGWAADAITGALSLTLGVVASLARNVLDGATSAKDWVVKKIPWLAGPLGTAGAALTAAFNLTANFVGTIGQKLGAAWDSFASLLGDAASWLASLFGLGSDGLPTASTVTNSLTAAWDFVADFVGTVGQTLASAWGSFASLLGSAFGWLIGLFGLDANGQNGADASQTMMAGWSFAADFVGTIGKTLAAVWKSFAGLLGPAFGWLIGLFGLGDDGSDGSDQTSTQTASWSFGASFTGMLSNLLGAAWKSFTGLLGSAFGWLIGLFGLGDDGSATTPSVTTALAATWSLTAKITGAVSNLLGKAWTSAKDLILSVVGWLAGALGSGVTQTMDAALDIAAKLTGALTSGLGKVWGSAKALIGSVVSWIADAIGGTKTVTAGIKIAGSLAAGAVEKAKGFWADAKAMVASGASWAGDLIESGWKGATKAVTSTISFTVKLVGKVTGGLADALGLSDDGGGGGDTKAPVSLQTRIQTLASDISTAVSSIASAITGYDPGPDITALSNKLVSGFDDLDTSGLGTAIKNWVIRSASAIVDATDVADMVAASTNAIAVRGFNALSGGTLGSAVAAWVERAATAGLADATGVGDAIGAGTNDIGVRGLNALSGGTLGTALGNWVMRGAVAAVVSLQPVGTALAQALNTVTVAGLGALSGGSLGTAITAWVDRAQTSAAGAVDMTHLATAIGDSLQTAITPALNRTVTAFRSLASDVKGAIGQVADSVGSGAGRARDALTGAADTMRGAADRLAGSLRSAGQSGGDGFAGGIASGVASAVSAARSGMAQILGILSAYNLYSPGYSTGASFAGGVVSGLYSGLAAVRYAASQIVAEAANAARAAAAIHSPSRLFNRLVGVPIALGVAAGMAGMEARAAIGRAGRDMVLAGMAPVGSMAIGGGRGGAGTTITNNQTVTIYQQPGESGDALARRVVRELIAAQGAMA